ncbi:MAG: putative toxin-antitoxin system toxin component, PIN family [Oscillospiraceae bacterium]|nr:putative toxin-antitoxin system toxin component, PIN family [Oscillospiraceae bacterium]
MNIKNLVVDTNIVISATISAHGTPAKIMGLFSDKKVRIYYNDEILAEYKRVLAYERLKIEPQKQAEIIDMIKRDGIYNKPDKISNISLPDESDRIFYDTAITSGAILITGNRKHFPPDEPFILTPAQFDAQGGFAHKS